MTPVATVEDVFDLTELRDLIQARELSATDIVRDALARADALDPQLGIMLGRFDEAAMAAAAAVDRATASGEALGPLAGVPLGVKAILACREAVPSAQSLVHDPTFWPGRDAPAVQSLRAAGGVIVGHTTMVEHAMGRPDPARPFPIPRNPWDLQRWPGGSSSGTAIGIAARLFPGGLGTDTAGSVRIPAAMCGVTALKPTHGTLPIAGCLPAAASLDVVGPMARSSRDLRLLMRVLSPGFGSDEHPSQGRIGVVDGLMTSQRGVGAEVGARMRSALDVFAHAGYALESIELAEFDELVALTMTIMVREVSVVHEANLIARWGDYGRSFRRLAVLGALIPDERYRQARARAAQLRSLLTERFARFDAVAMPTWPTGALSYFSNGGTPADQTNFTAAWNAVGFPAVSLPVGCDSEQMPVAIQLVGVPGADAALVALGEQLQHATDWHLQAPADALLRTAGEPIPDPDAAVVADESEAPVVRALRAQGFTLDDIDAAVVAQASRMFLG